MIYEIKLTLFSLFSIAMATQANRAVFFSDTGKRVILLWAMVLPFVFIIRNELLNVLAFIVLLVLLERNNRSRILTIMFFIAVLGAVPDWSNYIVSIPGVNYLIRLTYAKVIVAVLLIPILMNLAASDKVKWNITDTFVCCFVACTVLLTFRDGKITTLLRFLVDSCLIYLIPYFVFTRVVKTVNDLHYCALGFVMLSILLAALFIVSQVVKIDIYTELNPYSQFHFIREHRLGFLRLSGPFNGVLVGFVMLSGYLAFDVLKKHRFIRSFPWWLFLGICVLCVFFGGSRGALFGFAAGLGIYFYFTKLVGAQRTFLVVLSLLFLMLEMVFDLSSLLSYEDEYGTFDYRAELYRTSWEFLKTTPFFGSHTYIQSGYFNHLVTGLGIIDIVSAYLQIALEYGFVGLFLFLGMFVSVIIPLGKRLFAFKRRDSDLAKYAAMYFSLNLVMMFVISTTSMVSLFPMFIMINIAISRVLVSVEMSQKMSRI